jgi:hypothetical protein
MITVVDQVRPWFIPSSTFAATTHFQLGAQISMRGTGTPRTHPATRTGLRPNRSDSAPATALVAAFTTPKATMKVRTAVNASRWKIRLAISGRTVRSCPTIPPTRAFTPTRSENWARFARRPSRTVTEPPAGEAGPRLTGADPSCRPRNAPLSSPSFSGPAD